MWFLNEVVSPYLRVKGSFCDQHLAQSRWGLWKLERQSFPPWRSGRAGLVEVQFPSLSHEFVNTVQPLAACHSLCLADSLVKFDTLMSFLENLARFSSPSMADPFLLNSCCQTQMWGYPGPVVRLELVCLIDFKKNLPAKSLRNLYFRGRNGILFFVLIMLSPTFLKMWTNFLQHLLYQQTIVQWGLDSWHM